MRSLSHRVFKKVFNIASENARQLIEYLRLCFVDVIAPLLIHLNIAQVYTRLFGELRLGQTTTLSNAFEIGFAFGSFVPRFHTPRGATGSAVIFSMIQTALENGLDPYRYLTWLMKTASKAHLSAEENLLPLLPWNAPQDCRVG